MEQQLSHIQITLPNGDTITVIQGITGLEIAQQIGCQLSKKALAVLVNDNIFDLNRPIVENAHIKILTWEDEGGKKAFWHSSAHLLAQALEVLYPGVKLGIGPPIANGFYYDVDFGDYDFDASHFPRIEEKMLALAGENNIYQRMAIDKKAAINYFTQKQDPYKLSLLEDLKDGQITFYQQGNFIDLCKGPHIPHTGYIKAVKLLNIAGAYWRGNEKNKQLTRIYGITFPDHKALKTYLLLLEEAKKRNHHKLGKELKFFAFSEQVGIGLPLWLPRGTVLREQLEHFLRKAQLVAGYQPVVTPHIAHKELYVTSGHYDKYGEDAFQPIKTPHPGEIFFLKPMNCPHHCEIYKTEPRSYKELPLRLAEFGTVYRYEKHGELNGLLRTRGFTQDDAHIFCRHDQVKEEFERVIKLVKYVFENLGFSQYTARLSFSDPANFTKYIGKQSDWESAEKAIEEAAHAQGLKTQKALGEAAFYGPKLDFLVQDALARSWQLGTVQLDYQLPQRFELTYIGSDNQSHTPALIHRAPFGSLERFIAVLIEHTGGKFPVWLAPEQVAILPISEKYAEYADEVYHILLKEGVRVTIDRRIEKIGKKIRDAEFLKIPYMIVIGEKEVAAQNISLRKQGEGDQGIINLTEFIQKIKTKQFTEFK